MKVSLKAWQRVVLVLLLIGTLFQGYHLCRSFWQEVPAVWKTIGQSRLWRSANYAYNQRFAEYVVFLHQHIPAEARVVLPPSGSGPRLFSHTPWMQYFLLPRQVVNCSSDGPSCQQRFAGSDAYLLVVDPQHFPGELDEGLQPRLHMFDQDWGLLLPDGVSGVISWNDRGFKSLSQIAIQLPLPLLWLALLGLPAWLLLRSILVQWGEWAVLLTGLCLGLGVFTFSLFLFLLFIQTINAVLIWGLAIAWAAIALCLWRRYTVSASVPVHFIPDGWQAAILLLTVFNIYLAIGKSYYASDELIIWANKGYAIAEQGLSRGLSLWGLGSWKYTLNIPLLIAAFEKGFGDLLPQSKLIFPLYAASLLFCMYIFLQRYVRRDIAGLAAFAFGTSTIILRHSQIGYANMAFSAQLVMAVVLLIESLESQQAAIHKPRLLLAGSLFALAAWNRAEGFVISLVLIALFATLGWRKNGRQWLPQVLWAAVPILLVSLVWLLTSDLAYSLPRANSGALANATAQLLRGNFHLNEARYAVSSLLGFLLDFSTWGVIGYGVLFFSWLPRKTSSTNLACLLLWCGGALVIMIALGTIYATSYNGGCDVSCWVNSGLERYIMPGVALLWMESVRRLFSPAH